jgi:23S rRNA pseudouridine1911/1915/1917 synthase
MAAETRHGVASPDVTETHDSRQIRLELRTTPKIRRVDNFLGQRYSGAFSRTFFQKLIRAGKLAVNGRSVRASHALREGDVLEFAIPLLPERILNPTPMPLDILYEDDDLFVISKPANIICHPGKKNRDDTLANAFVYHMFGPEPGKHNPGIVHRLDADTTGVMVVAKNPFAHVYLSRQFEDRLVQKEYLTLVRGLLRRRAGQIDTPIGYHPRRWGLMSATPEAKHPQHALSIYKVLERFGDAPPAPEAGAGPEAGGADRANAECRMTNDEPKPNSKGPDASSHSSFVIRHSSFPSSLQGYTLVSVVLKTGRTHQIRVHFESIGHPVIGERYYRAGLGPDPLEAMMPRMALHAWKLRIIHPTTLRPMEFAADLPPDFAAALAYLRQHYNVSLPGTGESVIRNS